MTDEGLDRDIQLWIDSSDDDLRIATILFDAQHWPHTFFYCQQAIEKRLKALIIKRTEQFPPKEPSLPALAKTADLQLSADLKYLFSDLSQLSVAVRYPGFDLSNHLEPDEEKARDALPRTREAIEWLDRLLKQDK